MCCKKTHVSTEEPGRHTIMTTRTNMLVSRGISPSRVNTPTPSGPHSTPSPRRVGNVHHTVKGYGLKFQVYVPPTLLRDKRPNHLK